MIPVAEPCLEERDFQLVAEAMRSGWISSAGKFLEQFEKEWAAYCGMEYGIAVSNGSVALDVAVGLLALEPGDEVIMPSFTIISPAQSVVRVGGLPVLVDSDPRTWQMDVEAIEAKVTARTKAILVVHIYGHPADMGPVMAVAERHGLTVVEDAAEVHGAHYRGSPCGGIGHISTFSFYANKLITTGEGGMVLVRTSAHAEHARSLRNLCFQPSRRFFHEELGYNFRLTNVQAAMGVAQLERFDRIVERKRTIASMYGERLGDLSALALPVEEPWAKSVYWVYGLVLGDEIPMNALEFASRLRQKGVETRPFFLGMHQQPVFQQMGLFKEERYPVCERLAERGLYVPSGLTLTTGQIDDVAKAVREVLG